MKKKHIKYNEGDWFGVPLETGGWAVGIVARKGRRGDYIAYFFGPPRAELPKDTKELDQLHHTQAAYRARSGLLGLREGRWPILGHHANWHRDLFPNPWFGWTSDGGDAAYRRQYEEDCCHWQCVDCSVEEALSLPQSSAPGHLCVEGELDLILAGRYRLFADPRPGTLWWTDQFPPPPDPRNPWGMQVQPSVVAPNSEAPQTDNTRVLDAMSETSDMSKPHVIQRRFYFAARADAMAAKKALTKRKYNCAPVIKCDWHPERPWYLEAYHTMVPAAADVDMEDEAMEALAVQFNGEYDGWETGNVDP